MRRSSCPSDPVRARAGDLADGLVFQQRAPGFHAHLAPRALRHRRCRVRPSEGGRPRELPRALKEIDGILAGKQWILGDRFSVVDGYALVFYGWGKRIGLPVEELKNYTAWKDRMLARPAVRRVLEREQNVLVAA